jgi:glycosyltransferase involved in cell wall biosynthesis
MNVLVWSSYVAQPVGGQERFALGLALHLRQRGNQVVLVGAYDNAPELRARIPADMPYYFFDLHRPRIKPHLAARRLLTRVMREHQIEAVSAHGNIFGLYLACQKLHVPLVWTIHGAGPRPQSLAGRMKTAMVAHVLDNPRTYVIAISGATAEIIHQQFPRLDSQRLQIIHPLHGLHEETLARLPLPSAGPPWNLGFIARLVERKRPLELIEVARKLAPVLDFKLHVFGDGPLLPDLRAAIHREQLDSRFILHGYWDKGSPGMVEQIQVLVHTDPAEPFGTVIVEAQFGGRPVVAYNGGGIPEIVSHGSSGWLVPQGDTKALADGVLRVTGLDFTEYATRARQRAVENFSMTNMVNQYLTLFERACASR